MFFDDNDTVESLFPGEVDESYEPNPPEAPENRKLFKRKRDFNRRVNCPSTVQSSSGNTGDKSDMKYMSDMVHDIYMATMVAYGDTYRNDTGKITECARFTTKESQRVAQHALEEFYQIQCEIINESETDYTTRPSSSNESIKSSFRSHFSTSVCHRSGLLNFRCGASDSGSRSDGESYTQSCAPFRDKGEDVRFHHLPPEFRQRTYTPTAENFVKYSVTSCEQRKENQMGTRKGKRRRKSIKREIQRRSNLKHDAYDVNSGDSGLYGILNSNDLFFRIDTEIFDSFDFYGYSPDLDDTVDESEVNADELNSLGDEIS